MKQYTVYKDVSFLIKIEANSEEEAIYKAEEHPDYDWSEFSEEVWVEKD